MKYPLTVIAADPGSEKTTCVRVLFTGKQSGLFSVPVELQEAAEMENEEALEYMTAIAAKEAQTVFCCEDIMFYGTVHAGKSIFDTCKWIGHYSRRLKDKFGITLNLMVRPEVAKIVCYNRQAKDADIKAALIDTVGEVGCKSRQGPLYLLRGLGTHGFAALGVAVAYERQATALFEESTRLAQRQQPRAKNRESDLSGNSIEVAPCKIGKAAGELL